jgi:predicted transcriptional regulator
MATTNTLIVEPDQRQSLDALASAQLRSPEMLLREAINEYLARAASSEEDAIAAHDAIWNSYQGKTLTQERMLAEAEASATEFNATGLHVTHAEVEDWIERLHHDPGAKLPECHR